MKGLFLVVFHRSLIVSVGQQRQLLIMLNVDQSHRHPLKAFDLKGAPWLVYLVFDSLLA